MFNLNTRYSKVHNFKLKKKKKLKNLTLGTIGFQSISYGIFLIPQFKAIKRITLRVLKPFKGSIWLKSVPTIPITKKGKSVRMGKGVGKINHWINVVNPLNIILEMDNVPLEKADKLLKIIMTRISIKFIIICNQLKYISM